MILKEKYGLDDYYANSATQLAKGKLFSQKQLQKEYIKNKEVSLKSVKDKLIKYKKALVNYIKLRDDLHVYQEDIQKDPQTKLRVKGIRNVSVCGYEIVVRHMKSKRIITDLYGLYSFEYQYLNPKINHIKAIIGNLSYRQNRLWQELENLKTIKKDHIRLEEDHEESPARKQCPGREEIQQPPDIRTQRRQIWELRI